MRLRISLATVTLAFLLGLSGPALAGYYVVSVPIGVGTHITSVPYTIDSPGFYYFKKDLNHTETSGNAITIDADNVTIDLAGFTLSGAGKSSGTNIGIYMNGRTNVMVRNGTIRDFGGYGLRENSATGEDHQAIALRCLNNGNSGIEMVGTGHLIDECVSANNGRHGIYVSECASVLHCVAHNNGLDGIYVSHGSLVKNCTSRENGSDGIYAYGSTTIVDNTSTGNGAAGIYGYLYCTVSRNTVNGNDLSGIYLATACTAMGNTVYDNNQNDVSSPAHAGIRVGHMSIVKNNTLYNNTRYNIYVWAHDNSIEENLVTNSTYGIYFDGSGSFYDYNKASGNTTNYSGTATDGGHNVSF